MPGADQLFRLLPQAFLPLNPEKSASVEPWSAFNGGRGSFGPRSASAIGWTGI